MLIMVKDDPLEQHNQISHIAQKGDGVYNRHIKEVERVRREKFIYNFY